MLNERDTEILKELAQSDTKLILIVGAKAFIGKSEYSAHAADRLLMMTAVRNLGTEDGVTKYELTPTGRQMLIDPEYARQVSVAIHGY